jgi:hypothetical protein
LDWDELRFAEEGFGDLGRGFEAGRVLDGLRLEAASLSNDAAEGSSSTGLPVCRSLMSRSTSVACKPSPSSLVSLEPRFTFERRSMTEVEDV